MILHLSEPIPTNPRMGIPTLTRWVCIYRCLLQILNFKYHRISFEEKSLVDASYCGDVSRGDPGDGSVLGDRGISCFVSPTAESMLLAPEMMPFLAQSHY